MRSFILHIIFILIGFTGLSQKLSAHVSNEKILVGEQTTLTYRVTTSKSDSINFEPQRDEILSRLITSDALNKEGTAFEIIVAFEDTVVLKGSKQQWTGKYVVTAWDSGLFLLPGPNIIISDSTMTFDDLVIDCRLTAQKKGVDLYDIRENYAEIPGEPFDFVKFIKTNWWWILLILIALIGGFFYLKRRGVEEEEEVEKISLKKRTLIAIEALENEKMWERDKLKEHFIELSYILRSYLTARYGISFLERTTFQSKRILSDKGLEDDTIDVIIRILSRSDMVKFAKSKPDVVEILKISAMAKQIIAETSPLDIEDAD